MKRLRFFYIVSIPVGRGEVIWAEPGKRKYFRSILELMRLIGSTLEREDGIEAETGISR